MEETRPGQFFPVYEDERGTYIFNSKDLCMIEHLPRYFRLGVSSLKIEGRMKTAYYVATTVKAYREAIDDYFTDSAIYESTKAHYINELKKASQRAYSTGFYINKPQQTVDSSEYIKGKDFLAIVLDYDSQSQQATIEQRNKFNISQQIEVMRAGRENFIQNVVQLRDEDGNPIDSAPHPQQKLIINMDNEVKPFDMIRSV